MYGVYLRHVSQMFFLLVQNKITIYNIKQGMFFSLLVKKKELSTTLNREYEQKQPINQHILYVIIIV